ncbi:hypothetical protein Sru01_05700 [Sphaerisporangium rufum]|uniref:CAAX prenyl protease 2/Lysostaphin resistance protein A-like domain-containing protein n=1 Tax=Sphaerisporangium rufum TaxID=1381558 RepID=A0A919QXD6_9ACTN|nr:hypothetical protein Sru01_05700 [Sphaerisporangium rufum]
MLLAANLLNNRVARRLAPVTSTAAAAALAGLGRRAGLSWAEMGFTRPGPGARLGGALAAAVAACYGAGVLLPGTRRLFLDERTLGLSRARLLEEALVQVPLGTVLLEETAFRGVLPALLARRCGPAGAAAGAAALFGLWHVLPALDLAAANPALGGPARRGWVVAGSVAATVPAGLLFHALRARGGLLAPALTHLATNMLGHPAARAARRLSAGGSGGQPVETTWNASA